MASSPMTFRRAGAALLGALLLLTGCTEAPDLGEARALKGSVAARQAVLDQMKIEGLCSEAPGGTLVRSASAQLSIEQRTLIEQENYDRERIFEALARAYTLSVSDIRALFTEMQPAR